MTKLITTLSILAFGLGDTTIWDLVFWFGTAIFFHCLLIYLGIRILIYVKNFVQGWKLNNAEKEVTLKINKRFFLVDVLTVLLITLILTYSNFEIGLMGPIKYFNYGGF